MPLVTSGNIDRYSCSWGVLPTRYLKHTFSKPVIDVNSSQVSESRRKQYKSPKIIIAGLTKRLEAILDDGSLAGSVPTIQLHFKPDMKESFLYVLALANSLLLNWYFEQQFSSLSLAGGYLRIGVPQISELRFRSIDFNNRIESKIHERITSLAKDIVSIKESLAKAKTPHEKTTLQAQIDATDAAIDALVYDLYGLTDEEIKIVEATMSS